MNRRRGETNAEVDARWKEFWSDHRDFDSQWARNVLHRLAELLPFVFGYAAAGDGLTCSYRKSVEFPADANWNDAEDLAASTLSKLQIFRLALALRAYAYYGLKLKIDEPYDNYGLDGFLERVALSLFPLEFGHDEETALTIEAALARRKLDYPSVGDGLTPEELAALAGVSRKSIMNLLAPSHRDALQTDLDGCITVESARRWLLSRADFRSSIWQEQGDFSVQPAGEEASFGGDPVFIPVASDGSWFSPSDYAVSQEPDQRQYHVADGKHEERFEDYWAALDFLTRAASQRWRWRDAMGRWRMKTGTGWIRKARQEVEALLEGGAAEVAMYALRRRRKQ